MAPRFASSCPGTSGRAASSGWTRVELRSTPWAGLFQDVVYRLLAPEQTVGRGSGSPLGLVALNSDVLAPQDGAEVPAGEVEVRGYAFAGGDRHIARVDVSTDDGLSWRQAELLDDLGRWAWRHWQITLDLPPGTHRIVVRAWDSSAATQPEDEAALWNPKGYVNNARPHLSVTAVA